ncbi:MAG TPA: signal peptidase II [Gemmatimonadaceae bacterium]|nr:signal peptidase II [Gemmatimonadaceae bacterium]
MPRSSANAVRFWTVVVVVLVADVITKALAVEHLVPRYSARPVLGDWIQLRLVYNPGAAFGLYLGELSRWIFMALTLAALVVLLQLYRATRPGHSLRVVALALVCAGAVGNLIDRIRSAQGVVDFIDVGVGNLRWPTFNVADMAVSVGAFLLAWVLWGEDSRAGAQAPAAVATERDPG